MVLPVGSQAFRKSTVRFIGYGMPVGSQSAGVDHFALGPGAQAAESDDVGGVAQENNGTVGHRELRPAAVEARKRHAVIVP